MTDKILIVTAPDDTVVQGIRIVYVDLNQEQQAVISSALMQTSLTYSIINYIWNVGDSIEWLADKFIKSDLVIFNADSFNQLIVGWVAGHHRSYYFGTLKDLHIVNTRAIYNVEDILTLLEKVAKRHEQI
jgi:hypothetical protein